MAWQEPPVADFVHKPSAFEQFRKSIATQYQHILDRSVPQIALRWCIAFGFLLLYCIRVLTAGAWHIVTYALFIYLLNLLIGFLTPSVDPEWGDASTSSDGPSLPTRASDEFRPFMRRLPEFKCWLKAVYAVIIALTCTLFRFTDVPVFWPILVIYFFTLFVFTMKERIRHMITYKYVPMSFGKQRYAGKPDQPAAKGARRAD